MPPPPITPYALPPSSRLPETARAFLEALGGARHFTLPGADRSRCRAVVTLLHGNEPSGTLALHRLLREGYRPAMDLLCVIVNVEAALHAPPVRALPGARDQNRAFGDPRDDKPGAVAQALLGLLAARSPEAVLDLHNTSGSGPAYGVATGHAPVHRALTALFGSHLMHTGLKLGTLIEYATPFCPTVTIECGGLHQPEAHDIAYRGIRRFADGADLDLEVPSSEVEVHHHPVRVEVVKGGRVAYANGTAPDAHGADLTLSPDFDRHNFTTLPAGFVIGRLGPRGIAAVVVRGEDDRQRTAEFFAEDGRMLRSRVPIKPLMVTTNAAIAASDCLFYAVHADEEHDDTAQSTPEAL